MTRRSPVIEHRERRPVACRWRDRCLTVALWGLWWQPFDTLRYLIASEGFRWDVFVADLTGVLGVAATAVLLVVGWGSYDRWRRLPRGADHGARNVQPDGVRLGPISPVRRPKIAIGRPPSPVVALVPAGCAMSPTVLTLGTLGRLRGWDWAHTTRGPPPRGRPPP